MEGMGRVTDCGADERDLRDKQRAAWAGVAVNLPLAFGKMAAGWLGQSQALVADGVHSLSDLLSDAALLWALGHSHRPPDAEHPFGHGRFETLATLSVAMLLGLAAGGILLDAGLRLTGPQAEAPGAIALWAAAISIVVKEALYRYTRAVAQRTGSTMMLANAWHHRSDALSSVVALAGVGAALAGATMADAAAAAIIALMLGRVAWSFGRPAVSELVDTAPPADLAARVEAEIRSVPGVRDVHDLRLRRVGGALRGDAHVTFHGDLTLSEAHRLTEAARTRIRRAMPDMADILLHAEPEGHADGFGAHGAPLRPEVERAIRTELAPAIPGAALIDLRLDYRDDGIGIDLVVSGTMAPEGREREIEAALTARLGTAVRVALSFRAG
jgi:cation diffusion facilitator family transporter